MLCLIGADEGRVPTGNSNAEGVEHQSPASRSARWVHGHPKCLVPRTGFHTTPGSDVKPLAGYCCMVATDTKVRCATLGLLLNRVAVRLLAVRLSRAFPCGFLVDDGVALFAEHVYGSGFAEAVGDFLSDPSRFTDLFG